MTTPAIDAPPSFAELLERCTTFVNGASVLVVTVSYKTAGLVIKELKSLVSEVAEDPQVRVVVVDNTCGEDAPEIQAAIDQHGYGAWAMVLVSDRNGGYGYGNNLAIRQGLRAARPPEFFWMLNPDTEARPGAIRELRKFMATDPRIGIAGSALLVEDDTVWGYAFRFPTVLSEFERGASLGLLTKVLGRYVVPMKMGDQPQQVDWLPGASMMLRREVFITAGLFDERYFLYHEETDLCLQARRAGWSCWYVPASRVMHIAGGSTGVTSRGHRPKRRPQYVFDSRRRYFVKNHGWTYAVLADLAWVTGLASRQLRHRMMGRPDEDAPHLLADTLRNSTVVKTRPWQKV